MSTYCKRMSLKQFRESQRPISDETYSNLIAACDVVKDEFLVTVPKDQMIEFSTGFVMYRYNDLWHPVAWWYPEVGYSTFAEALDSLYNWFMEWAE